MTLYNRRRYAELTPVFAGYLFDKRVPKGTVFVGMDGDAVALWDFPSEGEENLPEEEGQAPVAPVWPADVAERMDRYDNLVHEMCPDEPYAYLGILACRPDDSSGAGTGSARSRRGLGRRTARPGIDLGASLGVPSVLETTNAVNVEVYARAGWRVHATSNEIPELTIWVLVHDGK